MRITRKWISVTALAVIVALLSYWPVLLAEHLVPPGRVFSGFLLNPIDGHTYLAKMHQGLEGAWKFQLDYAPLPGQAVFLYQFYLALGHLAGLMRIKLVDMFHLARVVAMAMMFVISYEFLEQFISNRKARWLAFGLILLGSGQGWLGLLLGVEGSDLVIPESIPFLTGYANAHFPLAVSLLLLSILLIFNKGGSLSWRGLGLAVCGAGLAMVLPFSCFSLVLAIVGWLAWEALMGLRKEGLRPWVANNRSDLATTIALLAGMAPVLLYDMSIVSQHPVISGWTLQNQTPSPPLMSYLFGFGLVLIFGIGSLSFVLRSVNSRYRFLAAWMISGLISLYLPIGLQRRLSLGLFYPMAALAALAWDQWFQGRRWGNLLAVVLLVLCVPSNLIVIGAGLISASSGEPLITYDAAEESAYAWIAGNVPPEAVFLASPQVGNRLPAYTSARVLYGHPFETPEAEHQLALIERLLSYTGPPDEGLTQLWHAGVDYVFYGPLEVGIGKPGWLNLLEPVYQSPEVTVYRVSPP